MKNISWDDLHLFLHVAETGGLSAAARRTGVSAPTLGRRILSLEHQTGHVLFHRSQTGYALTRTGSELLARVRAMQAAAYPVQEILSDRTETAVIRLSSGTGTAGFLADNYARLSKPGDTFRLNFVTTESVLDIAHRETDLGIRNRPADGGILASRKLGTICFAPYCSRSIARPEALEWVGLDQASAKHPSAHWVLSQGNAIRVMASSVSTVHQLIRSGAGKGVMPCFVGDCDSSLSRAGPAIDELTETVYLVMHDDDRHRPALRRVIERIADLYRDSAALLAGERSIREVL